MDFWTAIERLGLPTIGFSVLLYSMIRGAKYIGKKVVEPITESHIELVKSAKQTNELNSKTLEKLGEVVITKAGTLNHISDQNDKILDLANKNHELLNDLKKQSEE